MRQECIFLLCNKICYVFFVIFFLSNICNVSVPTQTEAVYLEGRSHHCIFLALPKAIYAKYYKQLLNTLAATIDCSAFVYSKLQKCSVMPQQPNRPAKQQNYKIHLSFYKTWNMLLCNHHKHTTHPIFQVNLTAMD